MKKIKIFAMYLPQYHSIPENDTFWGKGFTDWVTVKKATPLFDGHNQPRVPLNDNYYDLSLKETIAWQAKLAKEYGITGFGIYHYWFNSEKNILTKPAEILLENRDINIKFFFAWDNISWKRSWSNVEGNAWAPSFDNKSEHNGPQILIPYIIGNQEDWKNHFDFLCPYFKEERYEKKDNKPIFVIFHYSKEIKQMCDFWNLQAKENGFDGMSFIFRFDEKSNIPQDENVFRYEPQSSGWTVSSLSDRILNKISSIIHTRNRYKLSYDAVWKKILTEAQRTIRQNMFYGAFVTYDDTPRRGDRGRIIDNASPQKFERYLLRLVEISKSQNKEYIFLTAWNEWGEGAFLEPDVTSQYDYLKAVKNVINR